MSELKPCANCAGEATRQAPNMHRKTCIVCKECGMSTGWGTVEEVTATWNRRAQPDNDPLTLEQLREMDGEPVYVVPINQSKWICWENDGNAAYGLVRKSWVRVWREETADMQHTDFDFEDYGKIWLAYSHKPKEATHD